MSLFVSLEGGEGSGKSIQASHLANRLRAAGIEVLAIHEPGSTRLGWYIRDWLKRGLGIEETISHNAELFLFAAARSELVTKVIQPAMDGSDVVIIADRYADSTTAYQGYGRQISLELVAAVNALAIHGIQPDLTILLDCEPVVGQQRVGSFQLRLPLERVGNVEDVKRDEEGTRFEEEPLEFHERVRQGYLALAKKEPLRWQVLDANRSVEAIAFEVLSMVKQRLSPKDVMDRQIRRTPTGGRNESTERIDGRGRHRRLPAGQGLRDQRTDGPGR